MDRTTAYDDLDKSVFTAGFGKIVDRFKTGDRVVVQTIGSDYVGSERTFDQCVPGCPEKGMMDWLVSTCRDLEARADLTEFKRGLARNIRQMLNDIQEYPHSDIVRTIASVSNGASQSFGDEIHKSLASVFVFSDLIENSKDFPWPKVISVPPEQTITQLKARKSLADLAGAQVHVFGFGRFHDKNRTALRADTELKIREFWMRYFTESGARGVFIGHRLD